MRTLKIVSEINDSVLVEASSPRLKGGTIIVYDMDRNIVGTVIWNTYSEEFEMYVDGEIFTSNDDFQSIMSLDAIVNQYNFDLILR